MNNPRKKYLKLEGPILLDVCKDGTITYRVKGKSPFNKAALPFYSVETKDHAEALIIRLCKLQYGRHEDLPGHPWYRDPTFTHDVADISALATKYDHAYWDMLDKEGEEK